MNVSDYLLRCCFPRRGRSGETALVVHAAVVMDNGRGRGVGITMWRVVVGRFESCTRSAGQRSAPTHVHTKARVITIIVSSWLFLYVCKISSVARVLMASSHSFWALPQIWISVTPRSFWHLFDHRLAASRPSPETNHQINTRAQKHTASPPASPPASQPTPRSSSLYFFKSTRDARTANDPKRGSCFAYSLVVCMYV